MEPTHDIVLRVLLFQERHDPSTWIAQGLEFDVAAHGANIEQAKIAFVRTCAGYLALAERHKHAPFASLSQAPRLFWDIWRKVAAQEQTAERMPSLPTYMLPAVTHEPLSTS